MLQGLRRQAASVALFLGSPGPRGTQCGATDMLRKVFMDPIALKRILAGSVSVKSWDPFTRREPLRKRGDPTLIEAAKQVAESVERLIPRWEAMSASQLLEHARDIIAVYDALEPAFQFEPYDDPIGFITAWGAVLAAMPEDGYKRVSALAGKASVLLMASPHFAAEKASHAQVRWEKQNGVREWLASERRANPAGNPGPFVKSRLQELRERARLAGCPLSGEDASIIATGKRWLREAGLS